MWQQVRRVSEYREALFKNKKIGVMCLAIPGKIISVKPSDNSGGIMATASFGGILKEISLEMVPEAKVNDYVLVHVGVAISLVNETEAHRVYQYLKDVGELMDLTDTP